MLKLMRIPESMSSKKTRKNRIFFGSDEMGVRIINDDFLTTDLIENNSVDLIVTSPPYNVNIQYSSFSDGIPYEKYLGFTEKWLKKPIS